MRRWVERWFAWDMVGLLAVSAMFAALIGAPWSATAAVRCATGATGPGAPESAAPCPNDAAVALGGAALAFAAVGFVSVVYTVRFVQRRRQHLRSLVLATAGGTAFLAGVTFTLGCAASRLDHPDECSPPDERTGTIAVAAGAAVSILAGVDATADLLRQRRRSTR